MSGSILSRVSSSHSAHLLSPTQNQVDRLVEGFVDQATDWKSLAAITAGGVAYRFGKAGTVGLGGGNVVRALSVGAGLAIEVSTFELTHRSLQENPTLWRWQGHGGLKQGLLSSSVTFGSLKGFGKLAQGQNLILQHLAQDTGMVAGHQIGGALGIIPKPEGSLAEQYLHAEATNLQIGAGMALGHAFTQGKIFALERSMDLQLSSQPNPVRFASPPLFSFAPAMAQMAPTKLGKHRGFEKADMVALSEGSGGGSDKVDSKTQAVSSKPKERRPRSLTGPAVVGAALARSEKASPLQNLAQAVFLRFVYAWALLRGNSSRNFSHWFASITMAREFKGMRPETGPNPYSNLIKHHLAEAKKNKVHPEVWMGRALREAPSEAVEAALDILFKGSIASPLETLEKKVAWIQINRLKGGARFLKDVYVSNKKWKGVSSTLQGIEMDGVNPHRAYNEIREQLDLAKSLIEFGQAEEALPFVQRVAKAAAGSHLGFQANQILLKSGRVEEALENLSSLLTNPQCKEQAAEILMEHESTKKVALDLLLSMAIKEESERAAIILAWNHSTEAIPILLEALKVRRAELGARENSSKGSGSRLVGILDEYLEGGKEAKFEAVVRALAQTKSTDAVSSLLNLFEGSPVGSFQWRCTARALIESGAQEQVRKRAIPWMAKNLKQPNAASKILTHMAEREHDPHGMPDPELRAAAARMAGELQWKDAIPFLEAIEKSALEENAVRHAALVALAELGRRDFAEAALREGLQYSDAFEAAALLDRIAPGWSDFIPGTERKKELPARGYRQLPTEPMAEVQDENGRQYRLYYEGQEPKQALEDGSGAFYQIFIMMREQNSYEEKWLGIVPLRTTTIDEAFEFSLVPDGGGLSLRLKMTAKEALQKRLLVLQEDGTLQVNPEVLRIFAEELRPTPLPAEPFETEENPKLRVSVGEEKAAETAALPQASPKDMEDEAAAFDEAREEEARARSSNARRK